jgi:hypothetical protein
MVACEEWLGILAAGGRRGELGRENDMVCHVTRFYLKVGKYTKRNKNIT